MPALRRQAEHTQTEFGQTGRERSPLPVRGNRAEGFDYPPKLGDPLLRELVLLHQVTKLLLGGEERLLLRIAVHVGHVAIIFAQILHHR